MSRRLTVAGITRIPCRPFSTGIHDPRPNSGAAGFGTCHLQIDPVIAASRGSEGAQRVRVSDGRPADFRHDLVIAVIVQVCECDAMAFVQFAGTRGGSHIDE